MVLILFRTFNPSGNISSSLPSSVFTKGIDQEILDYCVEDNTHPEKRVHNLNINMKTKKIHPPTETYYIKQKMFSQLPFAIGSNALVVLEPSSVAIAGGKCMHGYEYQNHKNHKHPTKDAMLCC